MSDNRTPLRQAVDKLIGEGKIKADKDLQQIFGLSKGTISKYLSDVPGKKFLKDFETKFDVKLNYSSHVLKEEPAQYSHPPAGTTTDYRLKFEESQAILIAELQRQNDRMFELAMSKEGILHAIGEVHTNLTDAAYNQHVFRVMTTERQRVALENMALLRGLTRHALVNEADSTGAALLDEYEKMSKSQTSDTMSKQQAT